VRLPRFRHFGLRLLVLLLGLAFAALASTYLLVSRANEANARAHVESNLQLGSRIYDRTIRDRIAYLAASARLLSGDYAVRQVLLADKPDIRTIRSSLTSYASRAGSPVIALFDPEGKLIANNGRDLDEQNRSPFRTLIRETAARDLPQASSFTYLDGRLHVIVVVPLYAPEPEIAAWFGLAFPIDQDFAQRVKDATRLELTFLTTGNPPRGRCMFR